MRYPVLWFRDINQIRSLVKGVNVNLFRHILVATGLWTVYFVYGPSSKNPHDQPIVVVVAGRGLNGDISRDQICMQMNTYIHRHRPIGQSCITHLSCMRTAVSSSYDGEMEWNHGTIHSSCVQCIYTDISY